MPRYKHTDVAAGQGLFLSVNLKQQLLPGTFENMLNEIKSAYVGIPITIVLDNAMYQRCKAVTEKAVELGIELMFLPTYSPNLNLIERLWRFVKKECLYSKYYKTSNEFETAIVNCLDDINLGKKEKIKSLMTLKFQLFTYHLSERSDVSKKSKCCFNQAA